MKQYSDERRRVANTEDYDGQLGNGGDTPTIIESDGEEERCPYCGEWYEQINHHWSASLCSYPPISKYKIELLKGMMMGDGTLIREHKTPSFNLGNTNITFLEWLSEELGWLCPSEPTVATEAQAYDVSNIQGNIKRENLHDSYTLLTRTHPQFEMFRSWWESGECVFPRYMNPSTPMMKMWYVSDGCLDISTWKVNITSQKESDRPQAIKSLFDVFGYTVQHHGNNFKLTPEDSKQFLQEIAPIVPGLEYKWAIGDRDRYKKLKQRTEDEDKTQTFE